MMYFIALVCLGFSLSALLTWFFFAGDVDRDRCTICTTPEERLLAVVHALLHRCYKYPTATTAEVPQSLKKELAGVCRACFSVDTITKHVDFVNEYKREFERDLDPESANTFPATLAELTEKLKTWKGVLQVRFQFHCILYDEFFYK